MTTDIVDFAGLEESWTAHNYAPLPVVISHAEGVWLTDVTGRRYIDILGAYSAVNFGHRHPDLSRRRSSRSAASPSRAARSATTSWDCSARSSRT